MLSSLSRSPSALAALALCQVQPQTGLKSRNPLVAASAEQPRYLQPSPPGLGLLSLLSRAQRLEHSMDHPSLHCPFLFCRPFKFIKCILQEETSTMGTGSMENCDIYTTNINAALLDMFVGVGLPSPKQVSSLWPGFDPPSNCLASQVTVACWYL